MRIISKYIKTIRDPDKILKPGTEAETVWKEFQILKTYNEADLEQR